ARPRIALAARRPHRRLVQRSIRFSHEVIAGGARIVRLVPDFLFRVAVDDRHDAKSLTAKIADEASRIGKTQRVPGERLEVVLVMDVEPDGVGENLPGAEVL